MTIFLNILFLVLGMAFLIKGADFFVSGASAIAKICKVPSLFIGLTIVALGTSLPELSVSITSAISNNIDLSVGNIVGSNMFNMLLILGLISLFSPIPISASSKKIDFPFLVAITGALLLFGLDMALNGANSNILSRTEIDEKTFNKNKSKDWYLTSDELIKFKVVDKLITNFDDIF